MGWRYTTRDASPSPPPPSFIRHGKSTTLDGKRAPVKRAAGGSSSPDAMLHHHHRHRRPSAKKARASPSSSYSTRCLLERKIYAFDQGHIKDGLRVVQEKAAAVGRVLTEEEKALADSGRGVALAIQDEQGRRYSVFWRSRGFGSTHYMMSGGGWAHFAENHRLHTGDVLRFCFSRAVPRADSGKLYLGVRVLKSAPVTAGGDLAVKTTGEAAQATAGGDLAIKTTGEAAPGVKTTGEAAPAFQKEPSMAMPVRDCPSCDVKIPPTRPLHYFFCDYGANSLPRKSSS
ncbi:unnamed protein product [Spirodela intermedia]|uniref:TF-B3 domain-containing protein n=1 Tax=Spirodela intermedia TaxID=51605 RepID=A0A7I8K210_SPIIN|nr:unnamed protein product [Spirodela intermedia]CAA7389845.1 unnamed protein product [Spirodela intermedia]CAA7389847.1 unnamed protein product [Spirodela intermedia]